MVNCEHVPLMSGDRSRGLYRYYVYTLSETITIQLHCALKYHDPGMALLMYWINMK